MKRSVACLVALTLALASLSGCYGKFALTRKIYAVNGEVKEKYLRSLVTWAFIIAPVYGVAALADFILFNTIEFWSGNNPVAVNEKNFLYSAAEDKYYVKASKTGETVHYAITHYRTGNYLDSLVIAWDLKTGSSTASYRQPDKTTEFVASWNGPVVVVQKSVKVTTGGREQLAMHR
jgi:hypothetical protein